MDSLVTAALLPLAQASQAAPAPGEVAGRILKSLFAGGSLPIVLLGMIIGVGIQILAYWISARVVAGEKGTFGNAIKLWVLYVVTGIAFVLLLGIVIPIIAASGTSIGAVAVFAGGLLLLLALIFLFPMKLFHIGFGKAVAFLILSAILIAAAHAGMLRAQGKPALGNLPLALETLRSPEKRGQLFQQLTAGAPRTGLDAELDRLALPAERKKTFAERQENLRKIYDSLDARQKALPPGDAKALAEYERLRSKYEELVRVMRSDYAAAKAAGTATPP